MSTTTPSDPIVAQWYDLFLDLWNQRYRLEQQHRQWLEALWKHLGGDPLPIDEPSVIVTAVLLRVRADFVGLDRTARAIGAADDASLERLRADARSVHDRWAAIFRAERID